MRQKPLFLIAVLLWLLMADSVSAFGARKLNDAEMDQVTAGDYNVQLVDGVLKLSFDSLAGLNKRVTGDGTISFNAQPLPIAPSTMVVNQSSVVMEPGAQQDLHSLVNIIAVNSIINCLLNLNVNVNSTGVNVVQKNFSLHP